ncbi:Hypothetical secreted protein [Streptococcus gallolyticus]|uniref:Hypothetical secreted protein n=1 Tax=Streptococcus gallolyticus TaxID=315405 RepID=A0A060RFS9_9STRE|nr:hypothetical protein [Streptococcus gallolyticus]CDO17060.1 Hypothetical secreted protein [Streptococcus gallolyticus]
MSAKGKRLLVVITLLGITTVCSVIGYHVYRRNDFKRAYEHGTLFEQLDVLMNSQRYVTVIEEAGYEVDKVDYIMYNRIVTLTTIGTPAITIESSSDSSAFFVTFETTEDEQEVSVYFELDGDFNIAYQTVRDAQGNDVAITTTQQTKLLNIVKKEVSKMLKTVYRTMYP